MSTEYCGFNTTSWNTNLNGLLSVGWEIDANNEIKYTGVLLRSSQKQVQIKGGSTDSNDLENTTRLDWKEREVISNAVSGEHTFDLIDEAIYGYAAKSVAGSSNVTLTCLTSSFLASILGVVGIGDDGPASVGVSGGVTGGSGTFFGVFLGVGGGLTISGLGFKLLGSTGLGLGLAGLEGLFCSGTTSGLGFKVLAGLLGLTAIRKNQF